ncbi:hypothetical protein Tco_0471926 [Tanacetum coccineum]
MLAAQVNFGFDEHFNGESPFDMGYENEVGFNQSRNVDQKLVAAVYQIMMKLLKGKGIMEDKGSASSSHAHACILDTRASDHMSLHLSLFISIKHLKYPIIVHLPDGRSKTVTIVGQVELTPSLILTDLFYVPDF